MNSPDWIDRCRKLLTQRQERDLLRQRQIVRPLNATHVEIDGIPYVNFSSNNYLGLTHHPRVLDAIANARAAGSGAAGLISGHTDIHAAAETSLAQWKGTEAAVLLPSGYQANLAAVQTLAAIGESYPAGVRFLIDKLAHASLIDAVRSAQSPMRVFPHNNMAKLRRLLEQADPQQLQVVLTESIFSMDGDAADLRGVAELRQAHRFVLLLDEAHGSGVYGLNGAGLASELNLQHAVDVSIVTLSKAVGVAGGAVCASKLFCDSLLNFGRAYIYSTAISPLTAACAAAAIGVMRDEPHRQQRVRNLARRLRGELAAAGKQVPSGDSPIIPIVMESEQAALAAADALKRQRLLVIAVRPPTVRPGSSRLRVTVSCDHTDAEIEQLLGCLKGL